MQANHAGLIAYESGVFRWSTKRLSPICREALRMLRMIAMRERVPYDRVGQASSVPSVREGNEGFTPAGDFVNRLSHIAYSRRALKLSSRRKSGESSEAMQVGPTVSVSPCFQLP